MKQMMINRTIFILTGWIFLNFQLHAQMIVQDGQRYFGNEWIDYDISYYKIKIAVDGIYEITGATMMDQGIAIDQYKGSQVSLFHNGQMVPLEVSTTQTLTRSDYVRFRGYKNRGEVDRHLYADPQKEQLNPSYSMFTDTSVYFLCFGHKDGTLQLNEINNDLSNAPVPDDFYFEKYTQEYHDTHFKREGRQSQDVISIFDTGEGFAKRNRREFLSQEFILPLSKIYRAANIKGQLSVRYTSNIESNGFAHIAALQLNNTEIARQEFTGIEVKDISATIENGNITDEFKFNLSGLSKSRDYLAVSQIVFSYPRLFEFEGLRMKELTVSSSASKSKHLQFRQFDGGDTAILWDLANRVMLKAAYNVSNQAYSFVLPSFTEEGQLIVFNPTALQRIDRLEKRTFTALPGKDMEFAIISHPFFNNDAGPGNPVMDYKDYRSSPEGGNYQTVVFDIEELTDMFAYGLTGHPLSMRNFIQKIHSDYPELKYVLMLGKGRIYYHIRNDTEAAETAYDFIPTHGTPGSDVLLACGLDNLPIVPIGRISCINKEEIWIYLDKLKQHESLYDDNNQEISNKLWLKRSVHLAGGDPTIYHIIDKALAEMADTLKGEKLGGRTTTFYKESSSKIEVSQSKELRAQVDNGISLMTFFGHSNYALLDFNIDDIETYDNYGKYYTFIAMGCYAGNTFLRGRSNSEKTVLVRDKGAIVYLANSTAEAIPVLTPFAKEVYRRFANINYGEAIGDIAMQAGLLKLQTDVIRAKLEQIYSLTYHGDPAVRYPFNPGPDFTFDPEAIRFSPQSLNAAIDSFDLTFSVINLGSVIRDSMYVAIRQQLPNGNIVTLNSVRIPTPAFKDTFEIRLPLSGDEIIGLNTFFLTLDELENIDELPNPEAEANNELIVNGQLGIQIYVSADDVQPVYPPDFSILTHPNVLLTSSSNNVFAPMTNYVWQLDTNRHFNSPALMTFDIRQKGGTVQWQPGLSPVPNRVYYWRVSRDSTAERAFAWKNRSFVYLPNASKGWNQSHHDQYAQDKMIDMELDTVTRTFEFAKDIVDIKIKNAAFPRSDKLKPRWFYKNETAQDYESGTIASGVYVTAINPVTGDILINEAGGLFGSYGLKDEPMNSFPFKTDNADERLKLINFVNNNVPDGHIVFIYTIQRSGRDYRPQDWGKDAGQTIFDLFEAQGAKRIRELETTGSVPYIFVFRKNHPSFKPLEALGESTEKIEIRFVIPVHLTEGSVSSTQIGPAVSWGEFSWNPENIELPDQYRVDISGISSDGSKELLMKDITSLNLDLSGIDAGQYPYLNLSFHAKDTENHTAVELKHWRVTYEGLPDLALNPNGAYEFQSDTLNQGDRLYVKVQVNNPTEYDSDSLLVEYKIIDQSNQATVINKRYDAVMAGQSQLLEFSHDVVSLNGAYTLQINLNPNNDQPELTHINNLALIPFFVKGDEINPLLNVTFDGLHIMDGDLVSSEPEIQITLTDENSFLALNDTSMFDISLSRDPRTDNSISWSDPDIRFIPATISGQNKSNSAKVIIKKSLEDGLHYLKVNGRDRSGNTSGANDYSISFEVINQSAISNVVNYPNPFTTSTRFVYTLTGSTLPDFYMIRIMTPSGKVVREITQDELGPLYIGTHMTDYAWEGTDEFGDLLATGVYLYQFIARDDSGTSMDLLQKKDYGKIRNLNSFFKKGIGKMVILR